MFRKYIKIVFPILFVIIALFPTRASALSEAESERYVYAVCVSEAAVLSALPIKSRITDAARNELIDLLTNFALDIDGITRCDLFSFAVNQALIAFNLIESTAALQAAAKLSIVVRAQSNLCSGENRVQASFCDTGNYQGFVDFAERRRREITHAELPADIFSTTSPQRPVFRSPENILSELAEAEGFSPTNAEIVPVNLELRGDTSREHIVEVKDTVEITNSIYCGEQVGPSAFCSRIVLRDTGTGSIKQLAHLPAYQMEVTRVRTH